MSEEPLQDALPISTTPPSPVDVEDEQPAQDQPPPVKRKGGRKPVYATLEERKQRNRQAQAAFRERRTDYIKQLESTMKENEECMQQLQQSNREVTEECHMLRYKTSLLEDLLYENGIDFQSELQARSSKSLLASPYPAQGTIRGSWPQPPSQEYNRDRKARSQAPPQKLKHKDKSGVSQAIITQQSPTGPSTVHNSPDDQPTYNFPHSPHYRISSLSLNHEPSTPGHVEFNHANGAVHSMQSSMPSHAQHFDEPHLDPSISHGGRQDSFYSTHANHMANYLGKSTPFFYTDRQRLAGAATYYEHPPPHHHRLEAVPHLERGSFHQSQHASIRPLGHPATTINGRARGQQQMSDRPMQRHNSFSQSPDMGPDGTIDMSDGSMPEGATFEGESMI